LVTLAKPGPCIIVLVFSLMWTFEAAATDVNVTVYIRADGSVDPATAPLQRDGNVYMLTGSVNGDIVVQKDDIAIDGAGHAIRGTKARESRGISVVGRANVTVRNLEITGFWYGIWLSGSSRNSIFENNIMNNQRGIEVYSSFENCIFRNDISNDLDGIELYAFSNNNSIFENRIASNDYGVLIYDSFDNSILRNTITQNRYGGIFLHDSSNSRIFENNLTGNWNGIELDFHSDYNTIVGNTITENGDGIRFQSSSDNCVAKNRMVKNSYGVRLSSGSTNNSFFENKIRANGRSGLYISESSNNHVFCNDLANERQIYDPQNSSVNDWNDGPQYGGNYWNDHNVPDGNMDGVGDVPYVINENNTDEYPLIYPHLFYRAGYVPDTDLNEDGTTNIVDLTIAAKAFGSAPGDLNWSPVADLDLNEAINILDISKLAREFGKTIE
jgi:parallel beta-helix repeat protein